MTRQSTFKDKVRARMQKTGERYATARHMLLKAGATDGCEGRGSRPRSHHPPTVAGYVFADGLEHDHALLASALAQAGVSDPATGSPFTETRLFGLSGGIGFMSFLFEYKGHPPMLTFVCRSWSLPDPVVTRALTSAGIVHERSETGSAQVARSFLDAALTRGAVVHATVDFASLPSSGVPQLWVGGMPRQANLVGRSGEAYVLDLGAPAVLDAGTLASVRSAAKKEKHRAFTFEGGQAMADPVEATRSAVRGTARAMVEAPYANYASNFGLAALEKQARLCSDAKDKRGWRRVFDSGPLACLALYRTWECVTLELTAPAGGRAQYADFLEESSRLPGLMVLAEAAALARTSADLFAALADAAHDAAPEVAEAIAMSEAIDEVWRGGGPSGDAEPSSESAAALGEEVRALRARRDALVQRCTLDERARGEAYDRVGEAFAAIHRVETDLQRVLATV